MKGYGICQGIALFQNDSCLFRDGLQDVHERNSLRLNVDQGTTNFEVKGRCLGHAMPDDAGNESAHEENYAKGAKGYFSP